MKNIILADNRANLMATLEPILKHWGYRILSTSNADEVGTYLNESSPCLLILGEDLLADMALNIDDKIVKKIDKGTLPVVALKQEGAGEPKFKPSETLSAPVDLFELFSFIQRQVEKHPRENLRLRLRLPGMYSIEDDSFILADVLSLSTNGLFFKAPSKLCKGDKVTVVFPLLGHCKEIEVQSTVLYTVQPDASNNFSQGFGVGFNEVPDQYKEELQQYIKEHFLKEVSDSNNGVGEFTEQQLKD
jgi:Tfp pilus assembly protein PilZ